MAEEKETSKQDNKQTIPDPDTQTLKRGQPPGDIQKRGGK
jgi:hypothetical protein